MSTTISAISHVTAPPPPPPPKKAGDNLLMTFIHFLHVPIHVHIKFTMEEESNEELAFLDLLLKRIIEIMERSLHCLTEWKIVGTGIKEA